MNKSYLTILILIIFIGSGNLCFGQSDWTKFGLHGNVKTYLELHDEVETKLENTSLSDNRAKFDKDGFYQCIEYLNFINSGKLLPVRENGRIIKEEYYKDNGALMSIQKFIYKSANEIEFTAYTYDGKKILEGISIFRNNRFFMQEYKIFEEDRVVDEFVIAFEYDANGNLISKKQTNKQGINTFTFEYLTFDEHKNWTKRRDYDSSKGTKPIKTVTRSYEYY